MRRTTTALGQVRFDAEYDDKSGHADYWWAFCLAEAASQQAGISPCIVLPGDMEFTATGDQYCTCERCGHSWTADSAGQRKACPRCGSNRWDAERLFEKALRGEPLDESEIDRL